MVTIVDLSSILSKLIDFKPLLVEVGCVILSALYLFCLQYIVLKCECLHAFVHKLDVDDVSFLDIKHKLNEILGKDMSEPSSFLLFHLFLIFVNSSNHNPFREVPQDISEFLVDSLKRKHLKKGVLASGL